MYTGRLQSSNKGAFHRLERAPTELIDKEMSWGASREKRGAQLLGHSLNGGKGVSYGATTNETGAVPATSTGQRIPDGQRSKMGLENTEPGAETSTQRWNSEE